MSLPKARLCSALLALSAWAVPALADPTVTLVATPSPVVQGGSVDIQVLISDVTDLYSFNFSLSFDSSLLQVTSVTAGSFLGGGPAFGDMTDNVAGSTYVYNSLRSVPTGVSGSGTLAVIHLNAIGTGTSALTFAASDTLFVNSNIDVINTQTVNGSLQVTAVPEPSTYLLMAAGIAGLAAWRRRQAA